MLFQYVHYPCRIPCRQNFPIKPGHLHSIKCFIMAVSIFIFVSCETEKQPGEIEVVRFDTLDYTDVIRTDNFFGISNTYISIDNLFGGPDTTMNFVSKRVVYFTSPEVYKTASITVNLSIQVPFQYNYLNQLIADGECIIEADKGHYLFKAGDWANLIMAEGGIDTLKMDKIITGQTIKISSGWDVESDYNFLELFTVEILDTIYSESDYVMKDIEKQQLIARSIDLFKKNATSVKMTAVNKNLQERMIGSATELDFNNDIELRITSSYRSNFRHPFIGTDPTDMNSRLTDWKKGNTPMVLLLGY